MSSSSARSTAAANAPISSRSRRPPSNPEARERSIKCVQPIGVDGCGDRIVLQPLKRVTLTLLPSATLPAAVRMLPTKQPTALQDTDMLAADRAGRHVRPPN